MSSIFQIVPDDIRKNYTTWKAAKDKWMLIAKKCEEYYNSNVDGTGTNYTQIQIDKIKDKTNIPVSVNFIHPAINQRTAILTQNRHSFKVISTDGRAQTYANIVDKMKHGVMYHSKINVQTEQFIKDMQIVGMAHFLTEESDKFYPGQFGVTIRQQPWDFILLDCNSKDATGCDIEGAFIEKEITIAMAKKKFQGVIDDINKKIEFGEIEGQGGSPISLESLGGGSWLTESITEKQTVANNGLLPSQKLIFRSYYDYVFTTMYLVPDKEGNLEQLFAENMSEDERVLLLQNEGEIPDTYVRKIYFLGDYAIWAEIMPLTKIPIVTEYYDWAGKPYDSYGLVQKLIPIQEGYDKIIQLAIMNGILTNNPGWKSPKGGIAPEDVTKYQEHGNDPTFIKEYVPQVIDGKIFVPERETVQGLSNFYPMIMQTLQNTFDIVSGMSGVVTGNAQQANIEVFSSLQQYTNAAMQRIILSGTHIANAYEMLGQVVVEFLIWKLKKGDYVFLTDQTDPDFMETIKVADDINNFKLNKFMVIAIPSTSMPTQRMAMATELMKIAQSSPDPIERNVLTRRAMVLSEMPEAKKIEEEINVAKQLEGKVTQLTDALDRQTELTKQMENKLVTITVQNKVLMAQQKGLIGIAHEVGKSEAELSMVNDLERGKTVLK